MAAKKIVECVPNFSEGRDKSVIDAISKAIASVTGVTLLDVDPGYDTNRTVYTFVGEPELVSTAACLAAKTAYSLIDMRTQHGAHPRMGAMDVCPFVPVSGMTMDETVAIAKKTAERISKELSVPIYLYEYAASCDARKSLANIRSGEYEGLALKLKEPEWKPDFGTTDFVPSWGASVVGARDFLVAYNVNLNTRDKKLANNVALSVREAGKAKRDENGNIVKDSNGKNIMVPGRLKNVRAIGWYIEQYKMAQVSINLTNHKKTSLYTVYETVKEEAEKVGLAVCGSELVGLVPLDAITEAGRYYLKRAGKSEGAPECELIDVAVKTMGLDSVSPFDPNKKIIEYASKASSPLMDLRCDSFVDEVSSDSPAPGGGSVSALAGSLAAALSSMVANLTVGKKGYEKYWDSLSEMAVRAQAIKKELVSAVDEDTNAFNAVMAANKLPKSTAEEKRIREEAIQAGYKAAIEVPLRTAELCLKALYLTEEAVKGNKNSSSDAGVGALLARSGVHGACLNVLINLPSVNDKNYVEQMKAKVSKLRNDSNIVAERVLKEVEATFA